MAASFTIAARNNGFTKADARDATLASVRAYREAMAEFARDATMDIWYAHLSETTLMAAIESFAAAQHGQGDEEAAKKASARRARRAARKAAEKARTRDSLQALSKLGRARRRPATGSSASRRSSIPLRDLAAMYGHLRRRARARDPRAVPRLPGDACRTTAATCSSGSRSSTWRARSSASAASARARSSCLLQGRDQHDPLFLQVKEATASVLEDHLPKSRYKQPGERVVQGQRLMQAASDIFLGWTKGAQANRYLYWRQLRDMKGSAVVEAMTPGRARRSTRALCGWTLARAHARSGDPIAIAAYLGKKRRVRRVDHRLLRALRRPERARLRGLHQSDRFGTIASESRASDAVDDHSP